MSCDYCAEPLASEDVAHGHCDLLDCALACPDCRDAAADDARSDRAYDAERHG